MAVQQSDGRHGVSQQSVPEAIESLREEARSGSSVLEVEAVGVEFGEAGGGDYDAWRVFGLDDVEGEVDDFAEDLEVVVRYGFSRGDSESGRLLLLTVVRRLSGGLAKVSR
jgi:hypothetical protein